MFDNPARHLWFIPGVRVSPAFGRSGNWRGSKSEAKPPKARSRALVQHPRVCARSAEHRVAYGVGCCKIYMDVTSWDPLVYAYRVLQAPLSDVIQSLRVMKGKGSKSNM